jgi:outer membrane protein TolC
MATSRNTSWLICFLPLLPCVFTVFEIQAGALEDFLSEEIKKSPTYIEIQQNLAISESQYQTYRSAFLPMVSAQWNHVKNNRSDGFDSILGLNARQTLFGGGSEYTELKAATLLLQKSEEELKDTHALLLSQSLLLSLRWQFQNMRLEVLHRVKEAQENRIRELARRVRLGQSREPDLLQAQIETSNIERRILDTLSAKDKVEEALRSLLQYDDVQFASLIPRIQNLGPLEHLDRTRTPLEQFKTKSLELASQAFAQQESSAWLRAMPNLGIYGQRNLIRPNSATNEWEVGLRAQWTLFEGLRTPAEVKAAEARRIVSEKKLYALLYQQKINSQRLQRDQERLDLKLSSVNNDINKAKRALNQQEKDYRLGLVTELEVQQTLQSLLNLELEALELQEKQASLIIQKHLKGEVIP